MPTIKQTIMRTNGLVEDICEHGIGHPNKAKTKANFYYAIHGCDGCCSKWGKAPMKEDKKPLTEDAGLRRSEIKIPLVADPGTISEESEGHHEGQF